MVNMKTPKGAIAFKVGDYPESPLAMLGIIKRQPIPSVDHVECSFCHTYTPRVTATFGTTSRASIDVSIDHDGPTEHKQHYQTQLIACPSCAGNIRPSVDRHGVIIRSNMSWPESEG